MWFILEFYITQILISTTSRAEFISGLIKVAHRSIILHRHESTIPANNAL
jgi:hypothetical protein